MSDLINLPPINGIEGAVYDPKKSANEQSDLAKLWAFVVRTLPHDEQLSTCEYSINGNKIRYPKKVWVYEGVQYIEETRFTFNTYHAQFFARKSATAKIERL
ncbi:MAG: hypothetical protein ACPGJS_00525 [Flammeovirgaceae bacterium]